MLQSMPSAPAVRNLHRIPVRGIIADDPLGAASGMPPTATTSTLSRPLRRVSGAAVASPSHAVLCSGSDGGRSESPLAEIDLEFLGRQVALLLAGQREIKARLAAIEERLAETATRDLMLCMLRSFEGQVEVASIRTELLRETLEARIKAPKAPLEALEAER
jgi:hypothetical protein